MVDVVVLLEVVMVVLVGGVDGGGEGGDYENGGSGSVGDGGDIGGAVDASIGVSGVVVEMVVMMEMGLYLKLFSCMRFSSSSILSEVYFSGFFVEGYLSKK